MTRLTRRRLLGTGGAAAALAVLGGCAASTKGDFAPKTGRRVVVVGGGWAGATAARYLRLHDPGIEVVLVEPNRRFVSCPFSNLVLSRVRTLDSLTFDYAGLRRHGVRLLHEPAAAIDPAARRVRVGEGYLEYDRLIVAPGVEFQWDQVDGLAAAQDQVLYAWKAGPQTLELARRLHALPDGGVFVLTVPPMAYRCPPGPYERVCQVAWYLKNTKPRSKLIVLDANPNIASKAALFRAAWQAYPNIEYRPSSKVVKVDAGAREVTTELGERVKYDVVNLIPPQRAGAVAAQADLVGPDKRWCEVSHVTYESVKHRGIHVIGDATTGLPVPKSGNVANAMGKICASAVAHLLNGKEPPAMAPGNTCYSWVSDREAIAVVNVYKIEKDKVVQIEQKLTPTQSPAVASNSLGWARSIWSDVLGAISLILVLLTAGAAAAGPLDAPGYAQAFTCSACHGFAGNSKADSVPILAGMPPAYLTKALQDYASGKRPSTEMEPYAKMALHVGVAEVAAYFAGQTREPWVGRVDEAAVARGRTAAAACAVCHGADGRGDAAKGIPDLRGQPAGYLESQMRLFKADRRSPGDEALKAVKALMRTIPDERLADLAAFFASRR
jgi:cytochrome c553